MKYILLRIYTVPINLIIDLLHIISGKLILHADNLWWNYHKKIKDSVIDVKK